MRIAVGLARATGRTFVVVREGERLAHVDVERESIAGREIMGVGLPPVNWGSVFWYGVVAVSVGTAVVWLLRMPAC